MIFTILITVFACHSVCQNITCMSKYSSISSKNIKCMAEAGGDDESHFDFMSF